MAAISFYGPLGAGHVNPTLGIVAELVRRGHTVTYYAPRRFADGVAETGADFVPAARRRDAGAAGFPGHRVQRPARLLPDAR